MITQTTRWRGLAAQRLEAGGTSLVVVPGRGGKIVSLRGADGAEWLAQGDPDRRVAPPGTHFEQAEMCGWDECAPTIDACVTTAGAVVPDHGDAWDQAWEDDGAGRSTVALPSIGATLERRLRIGPDGRVTMRYTVRAPLEPVAAVPVLWAAHPQFRLLPGDTVEIDAVRPLWDVSTGDAVPEPDPAHVVLNRPRVAGRTQKHYTDPGERPRWARLIRSDGAALRMSWSGSAVRTLGVWIDRSCFAAEDVVALEPATGWFDSVARAEAEDLVLRVPAGGAASWSLTVDPTATALE